LAHDTELPVAEPVIRFSPLLTEQDLLALLTEAPHHATIISVARRPHLNEAVCDRIAATANVSAIRVLLSNQSAAIREATLDALITSAAEHIEWHEPLVRRPKLPAGSARKLAEIVADHLLEVLANRGDLDAGLLGELRARLRKRLEATACPAPAGCGAETVSWTDGAAPGRGKRGGRAVGGRAAGRGAAQHQGPGQPHLEGRLHDGGRGTRPSVACPLGTRRAARPRSWREFPAGLRRDALAPRFPWPHGPMNAIPAARAIRRG